MNQNIESLCEHLVNAVTLILSPFSSNDQRTGAHKMLDEFRDTSPFCAECGFFLSSPSNSCEVRHFGLQLIEHYIKLHWNEISCDEKYIIKNKVWQILSRDLNLKDNNHVKMAVAKIIVEIIKREWPQQWPSLLMELHQLCIMGDAQTEVVLLIFLRLAEDIVQIQNVPDKRRKEVFKALCLHLKDLFPFFLKTLSSHYEKYYEHKNAPTLSESVNHGRIVHVTLETICVYIEWIAINFISDDLYLLKQLCHLLDDEKLQTCAAKCLLSLVERKGKAEDRIPILKLFDHCELFKIRSKTCQSSEQYNEFEKYFCQTLAFLGTTLSYLMGSFKEVKEPKTFSVYLNCLLAYTKHPNMVISRYTQSLWTTFLRDQKISQSPSFNEIIPILLKYEAEKIFMIGHPSKSNSKASQYSLHEFDSDEDFTLEFCKFRSEVMEVIKLISKQHPELTFSHASTVLKALFSGQPCPILLGIEDSHCLDTYTIWSSFVYYLESVFVPMMRNMDSPNIQKLSTEGVELLQITIAFNCEDLYIMSYSMSCTSALFFFANFSTDIMVPLLRKILCNLMNKVTPDERSLPKEVLNLRRHTCSLLIKLATSQPKLLFKAYDYLCQCIGQLMEQSEHLSALEKCAVLETLMILSNELNDYDRQLKILNEMFTPVFNAWLTDDMKLILSSPDHFIAFVGLNKSPDECDATSQNRTQLLFCVNVIKTCSKRCKIVSDHDIATKGKFIHPLSGNLNSVFYKNPVSELLVPALPSIFYLIRTLNALNNPDIKAKLHPGFLGVTEISDSDKTLILGNPNYHENNQQQLTKSSFERMKNFLQGIHDSCLHTLGDSTENLSIDFYMMPNLSNYFNECVFNNLQYLPDCKLRTVIPFLKPFFYRCPVDLCGDLVNILAGFSTFMFEKLSSAWQKFRQRYGTSISYEEQMTEIEEILEDQLNRLLTREYIAFLGALLQGKPMIDSSDCQMDDDSKVQQTSNSGHSKQLSELGMKIFKTEAVREAIVCTVFDGLHWLDTVTNIHCLSVCDVMFKQLLKDDFILHCHQANYLMNNVLYGLQELGEHESNQALLLSFCTNVYEKLRPRFPELREFLMSAVGCDVRTLDKMESIIFKYKDQSPKPSSEKQKKEAFRNVVQNVIGKNIGQYHKREIVIKNLPSLFIIKPDKKTNLLSDSNEEVGLCKLFALSD